MGKNTFELGENDCAIVIRDDMSMEMFLPEKGDDAPVLLEEDQHIFVTMAIALSMDNPEFRKIISDKIDQITAQCSGGGCDVGCSCPTDDVDNGPGCCGC